MMVCVKQLQLGDGDEGISGCTAFALEEYLLL